MKHLTLKILSKNISAKLVCFFNKNKHENCITMRITCYFFATEESRRNNIFITDDSII